MSETHRIRLRGPWLRDGGRMVRRFGKPRLIDPDERVWLIIEATTGVPIPAVLNDELLPTRVGTLSHDATALLKDRNVLVVDLEPDTFEARLEIGPRIPGSPGTDSDEPPINS